MPGGCSCPGAYIRDGTSANCRVLTGTVRGSRDVLGSISVWWGSIVHAQPTAKAPSYIYIIEHSQRSIPFALWLIPDGLGRQPGEYRVAIVVILFVKYFDEHTHVDEATQCIR